MGRRCHLGCSTARELLATRVCALRESAGDTHAQDPDGIHDMRVASRRLRAALVEHRDALPPSERKKLQHRARGITRGLSKARELDVTLLRISELRAACPPECLPVVGQLSEALQAARAQESSSVSHCVAQAESGAFANTGDLLQSGIAKRKTCYVRDAQARLLKRAQNVRSRYSVWRESGSNDDLHAVRVAFKKLRYACESHAGVYGAALDEFVDSVKRAQAALGDWNDFRVVRDYSQAMLTQLPSVDTSAWETFHRILDHTVKEHESRFTALAEEFFSKSGRKRFTALVGAPAASCCGGTRGKGEDTD